WLFPRHRLHHRLHTRGPGLGRSSTLRPRGQAARAEPRALRRGQELLLAHDFQTFEYPSFYSFGVPEEQTEGRLTPTRLVDGDDRPGVVNDVSRDRVRGNHHQTKRFAALEELVEG